MLANYYQRETSWKVLNFWVQELVLLTLPGNVDHEHYDQILSARPAVREVLNYGIMSRQTSVLRREGILLVKDGKWISGSQYEDLTLAILWSLLNIILCSNVWSIIYKCSMPLENNILHLGYLLNSGFSLCMPSLSKAILLSKSLFIVGSISSIRFIEKCVSRSHMVMNVPIPP